MRTETRAEATAVLDGMTPESTARTTLVSDLNTLQRAQFRQYFGAFEAAISGENVFTAMSERTASS